MDFCLSFIDRNIKKKKIIGINKNMMIKNYSNVDCYSIMTLLLSILLAKEVQIGRIEMDKIVLFI